MKGIANLKVQLKRARELGMEIKWLKATGEVTVRRPGQPRLRLNGRKKDGSALLERMLREDETDKS